LIEDVGVNRGVKGEGESLWKVSLSPLLSDIFPFENLGSSQACWWSLPFLVSIKRRSEGREAKLSEA